MNLDILITGGVGLITSVITAFISWIFAKRKYDTEVDHNLIENMKESLEFYRKLSDDNKARLEESINRCSTLETEVSTLRKQMLDLTLNICMDLTCSIRKRDLHNKITRKS